MNQFKPLTIILEEAPLEFETVGNAELLT